MRIRQPSAKAPARLSSRSRESPYLSTRGSRGTSTVITHPAAPLANCPAVVRCAAVVCLFASGRVGAGPGPGPSGSLVLGRILGRVALWPHAAMAADCRLWCCTSHVASWPRRQDLDGSGHGPSAIPVACSPILRTTDKDIINTEYGVRTYIPGYVVIPVGPETQDLGPRTEERYGPTEKKEQRTPRL